MKLRPLTSYINSLLLVMLVFFVVLFNTTTAYSSSSILLIKPHKSIQLQKDCNINNGSACNLLGIIYQTGDGECR